MTDLVLGVVQARMSSTRLPGKVLEPVSGRPMILRQIERLRRSVLIDHLVVATSVDPSDDPLADLLTSEGVDYRRGSLTDVADRYLRVAREFQPNTIVRLTADCPLAEPSVIDAVIEHHITSGADYTSNVLERTYPQGLDAECVTFAAFERLMGLTLTDREREHVTLGVYQRPEQFRLESVTQITDRSNLRWTVDLPADLEFVRAVYAALYPHNPNFDQENLVSYLALHPELNRTN
jgi:spore coat polysaccharide biosynthesis protein SpsF